MREKIKALLDRRSIRSYQTNPVSDDELDTILEAGAAAPSGMNDHKIKFVVFKREGELDSIIESLNGDPFYGAPTMIAVFVDKASHTPVQDGSLALGNMMNAAHMLGLGSCWINSTPYYFETENGKAMKAKYQIPSDYFCVGSCVVGYTEGEYPQPKARPEARDITIKTY